MKKKFMILLVGALFVTIMFSSGCKKNEEGVTAKFDITGTWTLVFTWTNQVAKTGTIVFTGSVTAGSFVFNNYKKGTYTVNGKNVSWEYTGGAKHTGTSTGDKAMSGTMKNGGLSGTWTATR